MTTIALLSHAEAISAAAELSLLLVDTVDNGASVGFHRPLAAAEAAVGLALIISVYRERKTVDVEKLDLLAG